jgi:TRAP-type mannitol/chloroaromatic compound transport system permease small subunit
VKVVSRFNGEVSRHTGVTILLHWVIEATILIAGGLSDLITSIAGVRSVVRMVGIILAVVLEGLRV